MDYGGAKKALTEITIEKKSHVFFVTCFLSQINVTLIFRHNCFVIIVNFMNTFQEMHYHPFTNEFVTFLTF